jgi:hypothetical protein
MGKQHAPAIDQVKRQWRFQLDRMQIHRRQPSASHGTDIFLLWPMAFNGELASLFT